MKEANDTICAISTPAGVGGIAVARLSGPEAVAIAGKLWGGKPLDAVESHTAHFGVIYNSRGERLDECVATVFCSPRSFTGEDTVEFSVHGSRFVQRELLKSLIDSGARMAEAGEFTRRAFAAGHLDLAQAEAVADIIASNSRAAHRMAMTQLSGGVSRKLVELREKLLELSALLELELDFSEEDVEFVSREKLQGLAEEVCAEVTRLFRSFDAGRAIKEGIPIAIVGPTNAGKSSLLNALTDSQRAIVSDIHGTTRDTIEETIEIGDYQYRVIDTAGLRDTADPVERIGIGRSLEAVARARIILFVTDSNCPLDTNLLGQVMDNANPSADPSLIIVLNKIDLSGSDVAHVEDIETQAKALDAGHKMKSVTVVTVSALTGEGLERLRRQIELGASVSELQGEDSVIVSNARHAEALRQAVNSARRTVEALCQGLSGDFIAQDLRETIHHLSTITGDITSAEILQTIFSRFCIGK